MEKYIHGLFPVWGIRFIGLSDNADTDNKGNKKSRQINGLVNEWYLEDMSENIRSVLTNRRQNGYHIGAFAAYGYKKDPEQKGRLLIDAEGSDKRYNFCLASADPDCAQLAVAESPIDALSLATLVKRGGGDWRDYSYLSLGGTASRALLQYLRDHPQITQVSLCLDNDKGGMTGMEKAEQAIRDDPELSARITLIYRNPPPKDYGKDYNEFLCAEVNAEQARRQRQQQTR